MKTTKYRKGMKLKTNELYSGNDGIYRYINNNLYEAVSKVEQVFEGDKLEEELINFKLPKIPQELFLKIRSFFKNIYDKYSSEVAILLWYNFDTSKWEVEVPKQEVTTASVKYHRDENLYNDLTNKGYLCVGTIHSHGSMSAFHSGVDDDDEYQFDGLHITIGKVTSGFEYAQRIIIKNVAYKINSISEVAELPEEEISIPKKWLKQVKKQAVRNNYKSFFKSDNGKKKVSSKGDYTNLMNNYDTELLKYRCPVCDATFSSEKMGDGFTCPNCKFPMNEDDENYILEYVDNKEVAVYYGVEEDSDDYYNQKILNDYNNSYLRGNF